MGMLESKIRPGMKATTGSLHSHRPRGRLKAALGAGNTSRILLIQYRIARITSRSLPLRCTGKASSGGALGCAHAPKGGGTSSRASVY